MTHYPLEIEAFFVIVTLPFTFQTGSNDRFWGVGTSVARYSRRDSPPAPYVEAARAAAARAAGRNPGTTAPVQSLAPLGANSSLEQARRMREPGTAQRRRDREPSPDREPPSYSSIWEPNDSLPQIGSPQSGASAPPEMEQQLSVPTEHTEEEYQPPPPEYVMTVEYPELYRVTERDPAFV